MKAMENRRRPAAALDLAQVAARAERDSLLLSRERIMREIDETHHPRRRVQLEAALDYLNGKLRVVERSENSSSVSG